ncbi:MAG TPA: DUF370 domain-containing protein [Firmicutes bacterium]|jgi:hypothetical protein|nr:DUF370 domain-containing protein [Bacillota bacterium]
MLHLGEEIVIPFNKIIAILDVKTLSLSEINTEFFQTAQDEGFIRKISDKVKSYIITTDNDIYLSPISSVTLKARFEKGYKVL